MIEHDIRKSEDEQNHASQTCFKAAFLNLR